MYSIEDILSLGQQSLIDMLLYLFFAWVFYKFSNIKHYYKLKMVKFFELKVILIVTILFTLLFLNLKIVILLIHLFEKYLYWKNDKDIVKVIDAVISIVIILINFFIIFLVNKICRFLQMKKKMSKHYGKCLMYPFLSVVLYWTVLYITIMLEIDMITYANGVLYNIILFLIVIIAIVIPLFMLKFKKNTYTYIIHFNSIKLPIGLKPIYNELIDEGETYKIKHYNDVGSVVKEDIIRKENINKISKFY